MVLAFIIASALATVAATDTENGYNKVRGEVGGYIYAFHVHEDK